MAEPHAVDVRAEADAIAETSGPFERNARINAEAGEGNTNQHIMDSLRKSSEKPADKAII